MDISMTKNNMILRDFQMQKFKNKRMVPTVTMTINVDINKAIELKNNMNVMRTGHVTITHIVMKAVANTLINFPVLYSFCDGKPPVKNNNVECKILKVDETVLVVPKSHRFAKRKSIYLSEVANDSFIAFIPSYNYRNITDSLCKAAGFSPKIAFEVDDMLMREMIELERGILLLPLYIANRHDIMSMDFSVLRIEDPDPRLQIGLSWLKGKYLSTISKRFRDYIINNYSNFL